MKMKSSPLNYADLAECEVRQGKEGPVGKDVNEL